MNIVNCPPCPSPSSSSVRICVQFIKIALFLCILGGMLQYLIGEHFKLAILAFQVDEVAIGAGHGPSFSVHFPSEKKTTKQIFICYHFLVVQNWLLAIQRNWKIIVKFRHENKTQNGKNRRRWLRYPLPCKCKQIPRKTEKASIRNYWLHELWHNQWTKCRTAVEN